MKNVLEKFFILLQQIPKLIKIFRTPLLQQILLLHVHLAEHVFLILVCIFNYTILFISSISIDSELSAAKVALHSHVPHQICGREDERRLIQQFCAQKLSNSNDENDHINNPCLYIYGAPGTG